MSKKYQQPERGQVWRNRKTGVETTIISIPPRWDYLGFVVHQSKRLTHTRPNGFYSKYEFVRDAGGES